LFVAVKLKSHPLKPGGVSFSAPLAFSAILRLSATTSHHGDAENAEEAQREPPRVT